MIRFFSLLFILLLASSCKEVKKVDIEKTKSNESEQKVSVKTLNTVKKKEAFLEQIFIDDQKARDPEVVLEILKKNNFDKNSYSYRQYVNRMNYVDEQNFIKIMQYLEAYGYPDDAIKSIKARSAVATVTLHQQPNNKLLVYPYLKKAYEQGNLEAEKFSFVLNRMHINKFGKSYPHARTEEQNIVELLDILGLE